MLILITGSLSCSGGLESMWYCNSEDLQVWQREDISGEELPATTYAMAGNARRSSGLPSGDSLSAPISA